MTENDGVPERQDMSKISATAPTFLIIYIVMIFRDVGAAEAYVYVREVALHV